MIFFTRGRERENREVRLREIIEEIKGDSKIFKENGNNYCKGTF